MSRKVVIRIAAACFFLSGVAALLYEVVWTRLLGLMFGHTVYAITTVLATYMGGLALGSVLLGRRADRLARPLRAYGFLEAAIGLYCLATPLLFRAADGVYLWAYRVLQPSAAGATVLHLLLAAALLLPPTALMGATLPILSRAVVGADGQAGAQVGRLYALNTWGAVVGTSITGFILLPRLGLGTTVWIGVAINLAVAAVALLADRRVEAAAPAPAAAPAAPAPAPRSRLTVLALVAIGVAGAASMAYEIAWTRALSLVLGSSTYAFTTMLATFLVGLALGAHLASVLLRRWPVGLAVFGFLELAVAVLVMALLPLFGQLPEMVLAVLRHLGVSYVSVLGTQALLGFAVMILPTLLIGATFPVVVAALARELSRLGRDVGTVYGANTLGTIAGSVIAGFVLVRALGMERTVLVAAAANLAAGLAVVLATPGLTHRARGAALGLAAAFVAVVAVAPHWNPKIMTTGVGVYAETLLGAGADAVRRLAEGRELLFYDEGISTTVAVVREPGGTTLSVNGKVDASNDTDMVSQLLAGHLGPLLHPGARRALIVGLASGVTAGAVAQHPLEVIDVAELEPAMVPASRFFLRENRNALADPRVRVIEGDGRSILATAGQPYDLVVSEPSNPWIAGVASLFTLDFYRTVRQRLAPDGVVVQWLQNYSISTRDMRMVVRTMQEVFPHLSIWAASPNDLMLVATPQPLRIDFGAIERRLAASPGLREDFERYRWGGENLVFRFFLGEEDARRYASGAPFNTDDHPLLEFSAPLALYGHSPVENEQAMREFRTLQRPEVVGLDSSRYQGPAGHLRAARACWIAGHGGEAAHQLELAGAPESLERPLAVERARLLLAMGQFPRALAELERLEAAAPGEAPVRTALAAARALLEPPVAARLLQARAQASPTSALAEVLFELAERRGQPGFLALALEQLDAETGLHPGSYVATNNRAGLLRAMGDIPGAIAAMRRSVELNPDLAESRFNLGLLLEEGGRRPEALAELEAAVRIAPGWQKARQRLEALRGAARAAPAPASRP
ncbi:MAG: fused MFS/spermidine synthase [Deltaproteobacteria bacterium]|nr:fused MFS/spermidine synthase [Deltaproteobacteria bacterium]